MSRASRWFALAGVMAAAVALAGPSVALAGDCNGSSAVNIYNQGSCLPSAKGDSHTGGPKTKPKSNPLPVITPPPVSPQTTKVINTSGKDKPILTRLVTDPRIRAPHLAPTLLASADTTSVGSEFNLGSGPTILLALLGGTVLLLLGAGGLRAVRERRRS